MTTREIIPIVAVFVVSGVAVAAFAVATGFVGRNLFGPLPEAEPEELEPVVAGIGQGTAPVPKWLYLAYILIPLWAVFYMVNNTHVRGETPTAASAATPASAASPAPGGGAASSAVQITAKNIAFSLKDIKLAANKPSTIKFRNDDAGVPHNVAVFKDAAFSQAIVRGPITPGPATKDVSVPPLVAGTYYFHCDVHPSMQGTVTVA